MTNAKRIYTFGNGKAQGNASMKALLGGKGANLPEMAGIGLPVPPGFTITTEVCTTWHDAGNRNTAGPAGPKFASHWQKSKRSLGRKFGGRQAAACYRSNRGSRFSMPGMMDTVLNLGLNNETVVALANESGDARFAFDSYRRFIAMYSDVVLGIHVSQFESALEDLKHARSIELDTQLSAQDLRGLVETYKQIVKTNGQVFPEDPWDQLWGATGAVFGSWMSPRAITYRKINDIPEDWGTAVNVQAMVFGNMGEDCATGVAFTRDPRTGEKKFFGEFLTNAQGEDVVAGIRTPMPINEASRISPNDSAPTLEKLQPKAFKDLVKVYQKLEKHYRDMQDIEFTIEHRKLFMLQTRNGKRTARGCSQNRYRHGSRKADLTATSRSPSQARAAGPVSPPHVSTLRSRSRSWPLVCPPLPARLQAKSCLTPTLPRNGATRAARKLFWSASRLRLKTFTEWSVGRGILTASGGMTSHAAVVARGMGKCCVSGCGSIKVSYDKKEFSVGNTVVREGDFITLDGSSGEVILGQVPTVRATLNKDFQELMKWVDDFRELDVRTNADYPE